MKKKKKMRALTLKQPWLYTITDLDKWVENRSWKIPSDRLGDWIALHAGKTIDKREWDMAEAIHGSPITRDVPIGAIVGAATFTNIVTRPEQLTGFKRKWFFGPYGWVIERKFVLDYPIPCRGALSLWSVPDEIAVEILAQLEDRRLDSNYIFQSAKDKERWEQLTLDTGNE